MKRPWPALASLAAVSALSGVGTALMMPRGPITAPQVVGAMVIGGLVGGFGGVILRSRWAMLAVPVLFAAALEAARIDVVGPTVDLPNLTTTFGVLTLVLGRGFHAVVQLLPMMIGAALGAALGRRRNGTATRPAGWRRWALWTRRASTGLLGLALVGVAALMTRPGTTAPILDASGRPASGSVAELAEVSIGGHDQHVLIRGRRNDSPVLLYLAGGPGQSDLGYTRAYMGELEEDFVFAVWDQRGSGTSYDALDPTPTLTLRQAVADTIQLADHLRARFGQEKIFLFGNSWGSTLGVLAVQQRPDLFHAYIGAGQMVSELASDRIIYQDVLAYAARTEDPGLTDRLRGYGPPPYSDLNAYGFLLGYYDKIGPYAQTAYFRSEGPSGIDGTGAQEYGPLDKINKEKALADMFAVLYPQLQGVDFRAQVPRLEVPVYLVQGAHELAARSGPAREWFDRLQAPTKRWITFEDSGHVPQFEEFPRFHDFMRTLVRGHP